jgi:hypothetical protein
MIGTILFAQHFQILHFIRFLCNFAGDLDSAFVHRQLIKIAIQRIRC